MGVGMRGLGEGLFHLRLGSHMCGMFQSWRLGEMDQREGEGKWVLAV